MGDSARSVAYLGPAGTFTETAARSARTVLADHYIALGDVHEIAQGVEDGTYDFGVVPIENSVYGTVLPTLDELVFARESVLVREEVVVEVAFSLFENPARTGAATRVLSHPHALAQCQREILARNLTPIETSSTAEACRIVAQDDPNAVCIASVAAGANYKLTTVREGIQDRDGGRTRFYVLARTLAPHAAAEHGFRTALVLTPSRDRAGILLEMLRPFAERGLNLSSLMSRPLRSGLGLYCFIVIVDAHIDASPFGAAISELLDAGVRVKNLGSYLAWPIEASTADARAEFPAGSVAAGDPLAEHLRVLAPAQDAPERDAPDRDMPDRDMPDQHSQHTDPVV